MTKARGLKSIKRKIGDITKVIDELQKKRGKIHIFELGVGIGNAIMALSKKYGKRAKLSGMNLKKSHGIKNKKDFVTHALKSKVIKKGDINNISIPSIYIGDAGERIPLKSNSVDFVYSITTFFFVPNKAKAIEEIYRILKPKGIAVIHFKYFIKEFPKDYQNVFVIKDKEKRISVINYLRRFRKYGIRIKNTKQKFPGVKILEIIKLKKHLNLKLKIDEKNSIKLEEIGYPHSATRSVFKVL